MEKRVKEKVFDLPDLRNRRHVFKDREAAGRVLSRMLEQYRNSNAIVFAIQQAALPSRFPWQGTRPSPGRSRRQQNHTSVEPGSRVRAVAFDGTVRLNENSSPISASRRARSVPDKKDGEKVSRRVALLRGDRPLPDFKRPVLLVDDGLASGFTLLTAIEALRKQGCENLSSPSLRPRGVSLTGHG